MFFNIYIDNIKSHTSSFMKIIHEICPKNDYKIWKGAMLIN